MIIQRFNPWIGQFLSITFILSQDCATCSCSSCLKFMIRVLREITFVGGKYLVIKGWYKIMDMVKITDMQNKKDVDNDVVKLKLFPFSFWDHAKIWFSSLPRNSIDSWNKCKDAFITKYFPPAKIISLRTQIMNFKQLEHEHVAQSWERMNLMLRNCSWVKSLDDHTKFLCGVELFFS